MRSRLAAIGVIATVSLAVSCATIQPAGEPGAFAVASTDAAAARPRRSRALVTDPTRLLVVEGARSLIGKAAVVVKGKVFPNDCTGVVRAAYWYAGIDLARDFSKYSGNGVRRIFRTLEDNNLLYITNAPLPGDIIFWDNTYDRNEDGEWNDPLTHVGVVVAVSGGGQIEYVHANYRKGIVIEYMNLTDPDTNAKKVGGKSLVINSAMRMSGQIVNEMWLSSHLLSAFGKGYLLE